MEPSNRMLGQGSADLDSSRRLLGTSRWMLGSSTRMFGVDVADLDTSRGMLVSSRRMLDSSRRMFGVDAMDLGTSRGLFGVFQEDVWCRFGRSGIFQQVVGEP